MRLEARPADVYTLWASVGAAKGRASHARVQPVRLRDVSRPVSHLPPAARRDARFTTTKQLKFWSLARFADVLAAHNDWERFSSTGGVTIEGTEKDSPFLIVKDPPEHRWHRKIIGKVFTPRRIMELEPYIRRRCGELLDGFIGEDEFDVAEAFAVQLPLDVISELLNIPHELRNDIHVQSDRVVASAATVSTWTR